MDDTGTRELAQRTRIMGATVTVQLDDAGSGGAQEGARLQVGSARDNDLVVDDPTVSRYHLELSPEVGGIRARDLSSTNGTRAGEVLLQGSHALVQPGSLLCLGETRVRVGRGDQAEQEIFVGQELHGLNGSAPSMRALLRQVQRLSGSDVAVLIVGESGTGKERVAEALHRVGPASSGPFEVVDCGSLSPTLVASELFGHARGAFTGADRDHVGAFERAAGGTLFLDEIGELPETLQAALLGALERRRFRRVGDQTERPLSARVLCATHRELRADVNQGRFRLDLYYRLAVVTLRTPALRERREDIPLLVRQFLAERGSPELASQLLSPSALAVLEKHRWPGNVRELRNFVEATAAMGEPPPLAEGPAGDQRDPFGSLLQLSWKDARGKIVAQLERRYLEALLERAGGNISEAGRMAGLDRGHVSAMLRRHGLR